MSSTLAESMASFGLKLQRLPQAPSPRVEPTQTPPPAPSPSLPSSSARPSIDDLRDRIARIIGRTTPAAPPPRADPTAGELPFFLEQTELGPLHVRRIRTSMAGRVGRAPLIAARDADAAMLALLALDPALSSCAPASALFVDTETTGLAGGTGTVPFLIGMAWLDPETNSFVVEQALLRRLGEEAPMLALLAERLRAASMIVTYNGKSFDLPLLRTRFVMNRMARPSEPPHLDLVHLARRVHRTRLKSRTLAAIESEVLGYARGDGDIAGADIVTCYAHFLRTGDEGALLGVIDHNADDVLSMVALVGLYGEPASSLTPVDLADVARTVRKAGDLDRAADLADRAVARGGGHDARRARGDIAKARGDKARALLDYESVASEIDDASVRLELAKLYEHHVGSLDRALHWAAQGTGETEDASVRRRSRLERKRAKKAHI